MAKIIIFASIAVAFTVAGCVAPPDKLSNKLAASAAVAIPAQYQLVIPSRNEVQDARVFYLIKNTQQQWEVSFDERKPIRDGSERLLYWPKTKKVAFQFDGHTNDRRDLCKPQQQDRSKYGYTLCSSAFLTADNSTGTVTGRAIAGVITLGTSEIAIASQGAKNMVINEAEVTGLLEQLKLDKAFWMYEYREQYARAQTRSTYNAFLRRYESEDPEGLAVRAKEELHVLDNNNRIYQDIERRLPSLESYKTRYLPATPERYCRSLKSDPDTIATCNGIARQIVDQLATARANLARRAEFCRSVSRSVSASSTMCEAYVKNNNCAGKDAGERRVCDIINKKGQS